MFVRLLAVLAVTFSGAHTNAQTKPTWLKESAASTTFKFHMVSGLSARESMERRRIPAPEAVWLKEIVGQFEKALDIVPTSAEAHYLIAEAINDFGIQNSLYPSLALSRRAVKHWRHFEHLAPKDTRREDMLFKRSLALTKIGTNEAWQQAIDDYMAIIDLRSIDTISDLFSFQQPSSIFLAQFYSNAAELMMGVGDLKGAIQTFEIATHLDSRPLHQFGLAVALDRFGHKHEAREHLRKMTKKTVTSTLFDSGVFFVPDGDIEFYLGLASEALGDKASAIKHYNTFLARLPNSQYRKVALQNLNQLSSKRPKKSAWP